MSAYSASAAANPGSFASSSGWKRRFSSRSSSPGRSRSWTLPFGRPRWLASTSRAPALRSVAIVGMDARMRESSETLPSASGTLKSTRTKTRFPATSTSRIVSLSMAASVPRPSGGDGQTGRHVGDEVRDAAAVAPLVVVPGDHLDHVPAEDHGRLGVDDRGARVALEVHRHERFVRDAEDALEWAGRGGAERVVELLDRGRPADGRGEVDDAHGRRRDPQAEAVELALQVRDHERERLRRAGRGRDDVLAGAPRAPRVLVRDVEDALVVRVAVDGVHQTELDGEQVVDDLGGRGEAVRRAAGVADDVVRRRVVAVLVDAEDDRDVLVLRGGADDDLLGAGRDVRLGLLGVCVDARALQD